MTTPQPEKINCGAFSGETEQVTCPVCQPAPPLPRLVFQKAGRVAIWQCPGCELMYASPRFTEKSLLAIYENPAFINEDDSVLFDNWSYDKWRQSGHSSFVTSQLKVDLLRQFVKKTERVLDVGCAMGFFCLEASRQGYAAEGLEPSRMLASMARDLIKAPVIHNALIEDFAPGYRYNGIMLWDVLEHVYDPVGLICRCHALTEAGGYLFLQVPNFEGLADRFKTFLCRHHLKKSDFSHFGFPWHVYSFNRVSLTKLLNKAGYEPLRFESWINAVKDGSRNPVARLADALMRQRCLSDYITCVARKIGE